MQVFKFGGSSVANATNMSKVLDIVESATASGQVVLVSSAISGCTDRLIEIGRGASTDELLAKHLDIINRLFTGTEKEAACEECKEIFKEIEKRPEPIEQFGELLSTKILARKLSCEGYRTKWIDSREVIIKGNIARTYENIAKVTADKDIQVFVAPGFIASDEEGHATTLGRGGSDYSAALYAAGAKADKLLIWTDVPGIMTTNPKDVPAARSIRTISYRAALDLARFGAKVLYAPTVTPAREAGIPFSIVNTFDPKNPGTVVQAGKESSVPEWMGVATLDDKTAEKTEIHLVGEGPVNQKAGLERALSALKKAGVQVISYGADSDGYNITIVAHLSQRKEALKAIHREFFEQRTLAVTDVFIAGYGAVGKALVEMIGKSAQRIAERKGKKIRIVGIANREKFVIDMNGIEPENIKARLDNGTPGKGLDFIDAVAQVAPRKSVLVDCTNAENSYKVYEQLFLKGINIVTSNRRALAVPYAKYAGMKACARENGVAFKYDTTVGTAIPILESISSSANSCDRILSIDAVVSCTLNYIISGYDGVRREPFATLLRRAQFEGLTEKDPRIDLGGRDALQKLLILAREAGIAMEESDVKIEPMLGPEYFDCSLEDFYKKLEENESKFVAREDELDSIGMRQRFVASIRRSEDAPLGYEASIKMKLVKIDSPFYWISGTENVTQIKSQSMASPLVLKGDGEGAKGAASTLITDILSL